MELPNDWAGVEAAEKKVDPSTVVVGGREKREKDNFTDEKVIMFLSLFLSCLHVRLLMCPCTVFSFLFSIPFKSSSLFLLSFPLFSWRGRLCYSLGCGTNSVLCSCASVSVSWRARERERESNLKRSLLTLFSVSCASLRISLC